MLPAVLTASDGGVRKKLVARVERRDERKGRPLARGAGHAHGDGKGCVDRHSEREDADGQSKRCAQHALLCDLRIASESAKMMLPEVRHGVVPDSGGTARLFQIAGHGLAADLALTGRVMDAEEALRHGVVSRVVPDDALDETCLGVAREIAAMPAFAVKMFRRTLARMANPLVQASIQEEAITQTLTQASDDYAEMKSARAEERDPVYRAR